MDSNRAKAVASAALLGFIAGYLLALVQRPRQRFPAPLSAHIQDTIDLMEHLRRPAS